MKTIAIIYLELNPRIDFIKHILDKEYDVLLLKHDSSLEEKIDEIHHSLSAIIIDNPSSDKDITSIISYIANRNDYINNVPVLFLSEPSLMGLDDKYINYPIVGMISTTDTKNVILNRIQASNRYCNSMSFGEFSKMLAALPSLIYLKDSKGRYAFVSQHWYHVYTEPEDIRGMTDFDIRKDKENARIARDSDLEVIRTGKGKSYIIKEENDEEGLNYLQVIKEPIKNAKGEVDGLIAIINNVTDSELLRQGLREKSITDQLTGIYNRMYLEELMLQDHHLIYPVTFISADCDDLKIINDKYGHNAGDRYICYARDAIKDCLPKGSSLFRMGGDEFLAVIQKMDEKAAKELLNKIRENVKNYKNDDFALELSIGSYTINNPKESFEEAVNNSDKQMYIDKKEHKNK